MVLFKTEKAQISGQMQIICACWDLWLDLKVVQNEVFRTNRHPCIISLSPRENVVSVVMLTRSNEGEQGAPSGDSRGPWGGHLGHGDDWRACELKMKRISQLAEHWFGWHQYAKFYNFQKTAKMEPIFYLAQLWVQNILSSSNDVLQKRIRILSLYRPKYISCYKFFSWMHCIGYDNYFDQFSH